ADVRGYARHTADVVEQAAFGPAARQVDPNPIVEPERGRHVRADAWLLKRELGLHHATGFGFDPQTAVREQILARQAQNDCGPRMLLVFDCPDVGADAFVGLTEAEAEPWLIV